jgi:hypothetical protein
VVLTCGAVRYTTTVAADSEQGIHLGSRLEGEGREGQGTIVSTTNHTRQSLDWRHKHTHRGHTLGQGIHSWRPSLVITGGALEQARLCVRR